MVQPIISEERGSKLLAGGALGPFALEEGSFSPRAPETVQAERRMAWRTNACLPNEAIFTSSLRSPSVSERVFSSGHQTEK
jgi:hypothetical protein